MNAGQSAATVVPFTSLYPLVTVVLAVVLLKEKLNGVQTGGIALALVSIYFFNVGREEQFSLAWLAFALLPIVLWGIAGLLQKLCTNDISAELSTLCFLAALAAFSVFLLAFRPLTWQLTSADWIWAIALGLFLGLGNLTLLAAFAAGGKAAIVSSLAGLYSVVTVPLAVGCGSRTRCRRTPRSRVALLSPMSPSHSVPRGPREMSSQSLACTPLSTNVARVRQLSSMAKKRAVSPLSLWV